MASKNPEQIARDLIDANCHLEMDGLDCTPFDAQSGLGKMHQLFGDQMLEIINELNKVLVA